MADQRETTLSIGERIPIKAVTLTVTELDMTSLPSLRSRLIDVARQGGTTTYGELKADLKLRHAVNGLGRLLDLVGVDCARRGEPSLAPLVVTRKTGEVGAGADADAAGGRSALYERWRPAPERA